MLRVRQLKRTDWGTVVVLGDRRFELEGLGCEVHCELTGNQENLLRIWDWGKAEDWGGQGRIILMTQNGTVVLLDDVPPCMFLLIGALALAISPTSETPIPGDLEEPCLALKSRDSHLGLVELLRRTATLWSQWPEPASETSETKRSSPEKGCIKKKKRREGRPLGLITSRGEQKKGPKGRRGAAILKVISVISLREAQHCMRVSESSAGRVHPPTRKLKINPSARPCVRPIPSPSHPDSVTAIPYPPPAVEIPTKSLRPMGNCFGKEQYPELNYIQSGGAGTGSWHDERTSVLLQLPRRTPSIHWHKEDRAVIVSNNAAMRRECARANDEHPPVPSYNDDDDDWDTSHPILARVGSSIAFIPILESVGYMCTHLISPRHQEE
ncbi:hypothetical protein EDB89DRAFT_1911256 [Lactarius sanguifluus]|nr:hypothetical protein EDB89DRAFT_1911256 [Lactarius sanguifluus]